MIVIDILFQQSRGGNNATMRLRRKISGLSVIKKTGSADDIEINKVCHLILCCNYFHYLSAVYKSRHGPLRSNT